MIIWLRIGETSKIVLLALAMFAPIVLAAQAGVRSARAIEEKSRAKAASGGKGAINLGFDVSLTQLSTEDKCPLQSWNSEMEFVQ